MKEKVLNWAQQFNTFCFLDNHQYQFGPHTQECLLAAGIKDTPGISGTFPDLQKQIDKKKKTWLFGHLNYDLKIDPARAPSHHQDKIQFPEFFFFEPIVLIGLNEIELTIESDSPGKIFDDINRIALDDVLKDTAKDVIIRNRIQKEDYVAVVNKLKEHILRGDCYEINYCQEFFASRAVADPLQAYKRLSQISPNPFSALYRLGDKWLICASPERFLKKEGAKIIAQPIKGTSKRMQENAVSDEKNKLELYHSNKDRSENVMIVDLVRNDLSIICKEGTVEVEELFGIYSFPQVHQMISTVSGTLKNNISFSDIIRATFPMGSMTGAPKKRVIELIEQYERTKRGIFSGAVGYISPNDDFDFNVVIRSILYNSQLRYLSFLTGSAITFYSDPEREWDECMLKAEAMKSVFIR